MLRALSVDEKLRIITGSDEPRAVPDEVRRKVDEIWRQQQTDRDKPLFNGTLVSVQAYEPRAIKVELTEYKRFFAQRVEPTLFGSLHVEPLAVSALIECDEGLVLGLRSDHCTQQPGMWELAGSGGIDGQSRNADGSFSVERRLKREIGEEVGLGANDLAELRPFCLIHDANDHVFDLGVYVRSRAPASRIQQNFERISNGEYQRLEIVAPQDLERFFETSKAVPVTEQLIRLCPYLEREAPIEPVPAPDFEAMARTMYEIRLFEREILDLFARGELSGTTHTCIGQEAISIALAQACRPDDYFFGSHRAHGHFLAKGGSLRSLFAEIIGRRTGVCGGLGGSQHLCNGRFFTNGVQGGITASAAGIALGIKLSGGTAEGRPIVVVFIGDGTLGQGLVYETMNMAAIWGLPLLYVLEDNLYAQSTPKHRTVAGSMLGRARAFGISCTEICSNDVGELLEPARRAVHYVRAESRPYLLRIETYRLEAHSKGDDDRDAAEIERARAFDPLRYLGGYVDEQRLSAIEATAKAAVTAAVEEALDDPAPTVADLRVDNPAVVNPVEPPATGGAERPYLDALNAAVHDILRDNPDAFIIGEDILDPYGGAFKVTRGLSTKYPGRVFTSPISEAGIVGLAVGAALEGKKAIVEIMFGDFIALAADQIINHGSKYPWMYNDQIELSLVVRTPMGGRRGYGPTHSQSLEKLFLGVPNLVVIAPSILHDAGELLKRSVTRQRAPVLFIEYKLLYGRKPPDLGYWQLRRTERRYDEIHLSLAQFAQPEVVILTYGGTAEIAMRAAEALMVDDEITADVVIPAMIAPIAIDDHLPMLRRARAIVTVEEGTLRGGWGAEVFAQIAERGITAGKKCKRIAAPDCPIPSAKALELEMMFDAATVTTTIRNLL